jgi:hypothetical protein
MQSRRKFLLPLIVAFMAMAFVVGTVIADELLGVISKVDVEGKKLTIVEKDTDKEVVVNITDETEAVVKKKGEDPKTVKVDREYLEKLETKFKKSEEKGKKISVKVTHSKNVASKIEYQFKKKKADN